MTALDILIVDDSLVMRRMLGRALQASGLELGTIREAETGEQALALIERRAPDLVLTDLNMPGMGGEDLVRTLRSSASTAALPVLVVSSDPSAVRLERVRSQGAMVLSKPFAPERLRDAVCELLGRDPGECAPPLGPGAF